MYKPYYTVIAGYGGAASTCFRVAFQRTRWLAAEQI